MKSIVFRHAIEHLADFLLVEHSKPASRQDWPTASTRAFDALSVTERCAIDRATDAAFSMALAKELINKLNQLGQSNENKRRGGKPTAFS